MEILKEKIRHVPDFPKAGILFYDITTLLQDADGFGMAIDNLSLPFTDQGIDVVVAIESRGFIFGAAVADRIHAGFTPVRKPGKTRLRSVRRRETPNGPFRLCTREPERTITRRLCASTHGRPAMSGRFVEGVRTGALDRS